MNLSVELAPGRKSGLPLANPVMTASGTCGYGLELAPHLDLSRLGAVVVKGLSLEPRDGHRPPRVVETASGLLNCIGLDNIGVVQKDDGPLGAVAAQPRVGVGAAG